MVIARSQLSGARSPEEISFNLRPSILLTFHSEFGEFDIFARNTEISFGLDTEAKRLLYVHKEYEELNSLSF